MAGPGVSTPGGGFWITGSPGRHDQNPSVAGGAAFGYLIVWQRLEVGKAHDVFGRYAARGQDFCVSSVFALDSDVKSQLAPVVACGGRGTCLIAEEDNNSAGGDFEIRGRFAWVYAVYLPQALLNWH
jgi:hypothetical protein